MKFEERYEALVRLTDNNLINLGLFKSYDEANDAAIMQATVGLPKETVLCYQINKVYINIPVWTSLSVEKGG